MIAPKSTEVTPGEATASSHWAPLRGGALDEGSTMETLGSPLLTVIEIPVVVALAPPFVAMLWRV